MKIRFFTNLSHEFRTPLSLILGPLDKIISGSTVDERVRGQLLLMQRNAKRLFRLINQLMDFRKVDQELMEFHVTEVDVIAFVRKIVENFNPMAEEKGIRLSFNSRLTYQNVWIDQEMIDKVLYNLLSNAFNSTGKGGRVNVSISFSTALKNDVNPPMLQEREYRHFGE